MDEVHILTKEEIYGKYASRDAVVYLSFIQQVRHGLTDDELYRVLIESLLVRHEHMDKQLTALLKQMTQSIFPNIQA